MFVRDPREHRVGAGVRLLQQQARERGDGAGECLLLIPAGLVAAVEQVPQQLGLGLEQLAVEQVGDVPDGGSDGRKGGPDDGDRLFGEHWDS